MFVKPVKSNINETKDLWQIIIWRMNVHKIGPRKLAELTEYSLNLILRGAKGEPALITDGFLRNCVRAFGFSSGRIEKNNPIDINKQLTREECIRILKPEPAMPTGETNFWEKDSLNN